MDNIVELKNKESQEFSITPTEEEIDLVSVADNTLSDVRIDINQSKNLSVPIAQLSALGAGVASLLPAFRTVTQTSTVAAEGLYRIPKVWKSHQLNLIC